GAALVGSGGDPARGAPSRRASGPRTAGAVLQVRRRRIGVTIVGTTTDGGPDEHRRPTSDARPCRAGPLGPDRGDAGRTEESGPAPGQHSRSDTRRTARPSGPGPAPGPPSRSVPPRPAPRTRVSRLARGTGGPGSTTGLGPGALTAGAGSERRTAADSRSGCGGPQNSDARARHLWPQRRAIHRVATGAQRFALTTSAPVGPTSFCTVSRRRRRS